MLFLVFQVVYSEDQSTDIKKKDMEASTACSKEDIVGRNWLIRFINSQVILGWELVLNFIPLDLIFDQTGC